jgi:ribose-phosphate pyrophosphokinase
MSRAAIHAFADEAGQAARLAAALGLPLELVDLHEFPDGETLPTVPASARTVLVYRSLHHPNAKLVPLILACDAWRRAGVERLVLVAPYLCYLRQDALFGPGQPLSRDAIGQLLAERFDGVVTVDPHLHRTSDLSAQWKKPVTVLAAAPALAAALSAEADTLVLGPDEEAEPWAAALGSALGAPHATLRKQRSGDREVTLDAVAAPAMEGRRVVLVDDVCSTGMTLSAGVALARAQGARAVDVAVTHALFRRDAARRLAALGVRRIVFSDSCTGQAGAAPLADLLAGAVRNEVGEAGPSPC